MLGTKSLGKFDGSFNPPFIQNCSLKMRQLEKTFVDWEVDYLSYFLGKQSWGYRLGGGLSESSHLIGGHSPEDSTV